MSAREVDEYLQDLEEPKRSTLAALRKTILEVIPDAEQVISYRVPAFRVWEDCGGIRRFQESGELPAVQRFRAATASG